MDIQLPGTFLIGGLLLLTILNMNLEILETNSINFLNTMAQESAVDIDRIIEYDLSNIGYSVLPTDTPLIVFNDTMLTFLSDVNTDQNIDTISFYLSATTAAAATDNPRDRYLYRTENGSELDVALGITNWEITYFDRNGNQTSQAEDITLIKISYVVETMVGYDESYGRAIWECSFVPKNLGIVL